VPDASDANWSTNQTDFRPRARARLTNRASSSQARSLGGFVVTPGYHIPPVRFRGERNRRGDLLPDFSQPLSAKGLAEKTAAI
jgi:hypothetical protein